MWSKVDDKLHSHPKAQRAGEAMALWVMALSWCAAHLTNGVIPEDQPLRLLGKIGPSMAKKLVSVGLWEEDAQGFRFHDYLDHNPDAEEVRSKRAVVSSKRREAGKRGANARWQNGKPDGKRDGKPDGNAMANGMATGCQDRGNANGKSMAPSRTRPVPEGAEARAHAPAPTRVPARETPTPPPVGPNDGEASELLVAALASGAGDLWADDGEAWRRERLGAELVARDFDEDGARHFGRFLRRTGVADSLNAKRFSPYWFVFGAGPQRAEFRHLDAAVEAFDRWCDAEDARLKSEAAQRQKQHARDEKKDSPPVRSAEAVSAAMRKAREDFKHLPKPRAAIEDDESLVEAPAEPNTTGAEQRGAEALGAVLENIFEAAR